MTFFGHPLPALFLYFLLYSFLGWLMETCYCSVLQRRLVPRGFLYGPICPIYGAGVLIMILFFTPLKGNLLVFYVVAVAVMSAWEYFVGWLLEVTTHMKYWDYSNHPFNLKGRICLWVALVWGGLSYLVIFWIHPPIQQLYNRIPPWLVTTLCVTLLAVLLADTLLTLRHLALISKLVRGVSAAVQQLQFQLSLGRAELSDLLAGQTAQLRDRYGEQVASIQASYRQQIARLERQSRRFRNRYANMRAAGRYVVRSEDIRAAAERAKEEFVRRKQAIQHDRAQRRQHRRQ
ncbi:MAG TPA: hypothetical protein IAC84_02280 [Firmicutes bacterium]|nr:hypothetical protein [Bacillota bacterium]